MYDANKRKKSYRIRQDLLRNHWVVPRSEVVPRYWVLPVPSFVNLPFLLGNQAKELEPYSSPICIPLL